MQRDSMFSRILTTIFCGTLVPNVLFLCYLNGILSWIVLKILIVLYITIFVGWPFVFKYSYTLQNKAIFLNFVNLPYLPYSKPSSFGLNGTRNFYLYNEKVKLGVWHVLPEDLILSVENDAEFEASLNGEHNIIVYNHGNSGSRGSAHRVELYKLLRKKFHVIAYDYRSYGDSAKDIPNERDLVKDSTYIYQWVANYTGSTSKIFVWGHSLGTSISTHALSLMPENMQPAGLILESPFNNMKDEISQFPLSRHFRYLPWFRYTVVEPLLKNKFLFETDKYILHVNAPILILHAEDDKVVPFSLGVKLYQAALLGRTPDQGFVRIISFSAKKRYGHKFIYRDDQLDTFLEAFVEDCQKKVRPVQ